MTTMTTFPVPGLAQVPKVGVPVPGSGVTTTTAPGVAKAAVSGLAGGLHTWGHVVPVKQLTELVVVVAVVAVLWALRFVWRLRRGLGGR